MKEVVLKRIVIDHWRGQNMDISFNGDTNIYGRNKIGKSTIFNAFIWVLTGCDSQDRSNFQLFDNRLPMTHENAIPAKVDLYLNITGDDYKFTRVAKQSWVRKRNEPDYTKGTSDNYYYYIDDIERTAREYNDKIEVMFAPIDLLKIILNIKHIFSLDWKQQREAFSEISPDIQAEDFKGDYSLLMKELERYSINELESRIKTISCPLNNTLNSLPETINTLIANLPDIAECKKARKRIKDNESEIKNIDEQLNKLSESIKPFIAKRKEEENALSALRQEMNEAKRKFDAEQKEVLFKLESERDRIIKDNERITSLNEANAKKKKDWEKEIEAFKLQVQQCEQYRLKLLQERDAIMERTFSADVCSYCGQLLPMEKLEELKKKFLQQQQTDKEHVVKQGKDNNAHKDYYLKTISDIEEKIKTLPEYQKGASLDEINAKIEQAKEKVLKFEGSSIEAAYLTKIWRLENALTVIPDYDTSALMEMKGSLMQSIKEDSEIVGLEKEREKQEKKIEEYKKQLRDSANELAAQQKLDAQLKAYRQEHATLVSEKVNQMFKRVKVEMLQQNKSGVWVPSCSISTGGVFSTVYNKAESILSGIDISTAFMNRFGLNMPLFIDDAESISTNNNIVTDRQQIKLIVSDDEKIKVE